MHRTRLILTGTAIAAMIAMAGCDPQPRSEASTTPAAPAASSTAAPTENAADDAATAKACVDVKAGLKNTAANVAKAEKIGPPAGHIAVSAQWAAGSAEIISQSSGASETVKAAADKISNEMMDLSDAYNESGAKPSKKDLDAAIKELNDACSAA